MEDWTPREPSAAETRELRSIRDMQDAIRRHMGAQGHGHGEINPTDDDMYTIVNLVNNCGGRGRLVEGVRVYRQALGSMDRGTVSGEGDTVTPRE